jgi:hypothetical protein
MLTCLLFVHALHYELSSLHACEAQRVVLVLWSQRGVGLVVTAVKPRLKNKRCSGLDAEALIQRHPKNIRFTNQKQKQNADRHAIVDQERIVGMYRYRCFDL